MRRLQIIARFKEQCAAAERVRERFGLEYALEYIVGEKLFAFVGAAERDPDRADLARAFAATIGQQFKRTELSDYFDRLPNVPRLRPPREHTEDLHRYARIRRMLCC